MSEKSKRVAGGARTLLLRQGHRAADRGEADEPVATGVSYQSSWTACPRSSPWKSSRTTCSTSQGPFGGLGDDGRRTERSTAGRLALGPGECLRGSRAGKGAGCHPEGLRSAGRRDGTTRLVLETGASARGSFRSRFLLRGGNGNGPAIAGAARRGDAAAIAEALVADAELGAELPYMRIRPVKGARPGVRFPVAPLGGT